MDVKFEFRNESQEKFFWSNARNNCFSGGFNNGKSYVGCQRAFLLLSTFENYGYAIARHKYKNLKQTTMRTFFKICPPDFVWKHDEQNGFTILKNKSFIFWMHLDVLNEEDVRGLEINSVLIDQAEEIDSAIKDVMEARVGRWDKAVVPERIIKAANGTWPQNKFGRYLVPNRFDILCNPNEAGELHWIYREYHPDSIEKRSYCFFIERETDEDLGDAHTMQVMKSKDEEWVDTYYRGKWGKSTAQIHHVSKASILREEDFGVAKIEELLETLKKRASFTRVLDHGETGITCCTWWAALNNIHIGFMEYYTQGKIILDHREAISAWSNDFAGDSGIRFNDYADPDIFKKHSQKDGAFNTVAMQYCDIDLLRSAPTISWSPADNNEYATRDRINTFLRPSAQFSHPITKESPAPGIYYIQRSTHFPKGLWNTIIQTKSQRRTLLGSDNGKSLYTEERDENIVDHAYDTERYYVAAFSHGLPAKKRSVPRNSLAYYREILKRRQASHQGSLKF